VTNKKKRPSGSTSRYREPTTTSQPPRRGLLDGLFAAKPPGGSPMPKLRTTLARGSVTALSIPALVVGVPVALLVLWTLVILGGYEGPFKLLAFTFAIPPVTAAVDPQIYQLALRPALDATGIGLAAPTLIGVVAAILFHAAVQAIVATLAVEKLRTGGVSLWAVRRTPRVWLVAAMVGMISLGMYIAGRILLILFAQLGVFLFLAVLVLGVYILGFAPAIAADEDRGALETLVRSVRAARMPGSGNLWLAVGYVLLCAVLLAAPIPGSGIGITPSVSAWLVVVGWNVVSVIMQTTLVYRYLAVAKDVPEGPPSRERATRR
jgi:hypothetical protein